MDTTRNTTTPTEAEILRAQIREQAIDALAARLWAKECNRPWNYDGEYAADLQSFRAGCILEGEILLDTLEDAGFELRLVAGAATRAVP